MVPVSFNPSVVSGKKHIRPDIEFATVIKKWSSYVRLKDEGPIFLFFLLILLLALLLMLLNILLVALLPVFLLILLWILLYFPRN